MRPRPGTHVTIHGKPLHVRPPKRIEWDDRCGMDQPEPSRELRMMLGAGLVKLVLALSFIGAVAWGLL